MADPLHVCAAGIPISIRRVTPRFVDAHLDAWRGRAQQLHSVRRHPFKAGVGGVDSDFDGDVSGANVEGEAYGRPAKGGADAGEGGGDYRGGSPFAGDMEAQGKVPAWRVHSRTAEASAEVAQRLAIAEGDPVMRALYVYTADGVPVQRAVSWEPYELTRGTPIALPEDGPHAGRGVRDRMAVIGVEVTRRREGLHSRGATVEETRDLGISPGAIVTVLRRTYFAEARPVETCDIVAPGDRVEFVYVLDVN